MKAWAHRPRGFVDQRGSVFSDGMEQNNSSENFQRQLINPIQINKKVKLFQLEGGNADGQKTWAALACAVTLAYRKSKKETTMLYTNLKHLENAAEHALVIGNNEHVVVVCGRMGPSCIPVYRAVEGLEKEYRHVEFFDMEFDNPESQVIRSLPEVSRFTSVPFVVYYKNGEVVRATSGIQSKQQLIQALNEEFAVVEKV